MITICFNHLYTDFHRLIIKFKTQTYICSFHLKGTKDIVHNEHFGCVEFFLLRSYILRKHFLHKKVIK